MAKKKTNSRSSPKNTSDLPSQEKIVPIVGVGASAGGLQAFTELLSHLSPDAGMAFVLIQHLDPNHESILPELLAKVTELSVSEIEDGIQVRANQIYIMPPNSNVTVSNGVLSLVPRAERGRDMPVDLFLSSLAEDQNSKAIGVILSGTASDGVMGLKAIKAQGGITFAQDEKSAKFHGMPRSVIAAGYVDFILPPHQIARELGRIGQHPYIIHPEKEIPIPLTPSSEDEINKILILLRNACGVDFTYYKPTTIKRRIFRRMVLHKISSFKNYFKYLQMTGSEVEALYQDILISVTSFFRDPETFETLTKRVFPVILDNKPQDGPIRVWVPGCSTGEEVYSIAICLLEFLDDKTSNPPIQIFATDVNEEAIEKARNGIYGEHIAQDVSQERLLRFFVKAENGYQISKSIRDLCIFARQDITRDPPFSKLDLISCRNLLIYLGVVLQKKIIPVFHYALRANGFLTLGSSETIGGYSDLFALVDKKHKIYSKKISVARPHLDFTAREIMVEHSPKPETALERKIWGSEDVHREADRIVLKKYSPAGVVINDDMEVLQFRGSTGHYLEHAPGEASLNLLKMAREGLLFDLRTTIHNARKSKTPIRKEKIEIAYNGKRKVIHLEVIPFNTPVTQDQYFVVLFESAPPAAPATPKSARKSAKSKLKQQEDSETEKLRKELATTKEYLQSIIEEQEATNEELRSANEEIQSSNEELQSTNEELETAKEELQSTNEELTTLNEELENRNQELSQVNNDLTNLLTSVQIPILILGNDLRIRRFTPSISKVMNIISTDIGRKISDIKPNVEIQDLEKLILDVFETLSILEREVLNNDGNWFLLNIRPYKTLDNKIEGVVLTFVDIDSQKKVEQTTKTSQQFTENVFNTVRESLLVLDSEFRIVRANKSFYQTFQVTAKEVKGSIIFELGNRQWNIPQLRKLLEEIIPQKISFDSFKVEHDFPEIGHKVMLLNARQITRDEIETQQILLAIEDISEKREVSRE